MSLRRFSGGGPVAAGTLHECEDGRSWVDGGCADAAGELPRSFTMLDNTGKILCCLMREVMASSPLTGVN